MMVDEKTKVFLLLDEAEKRQKTAEQQQAILKDLLQAGRTAGDALDKAIATLPSTVQRTVDSAVPNAMATAINRAAQTAAQALEKATAGPVERLNQAVTHAEQAINNLEQASRQISWRWALLILLAGCLLGTVASYFLFANSIRQDLAELRQQLHALQSAAPPTMLLPETPRKSKH
jgi:hypothetical protein